MFLVGGFLNLLLRSINFHRFYLVVCFHLEEGVACKYVLGVDLECTSEKWEKESDNLVTKRGLCCFNKAVDFVLGEYVECNF